MYSNSFGGYGMPSSAVPTSVSTGATYSSGNIDLSVIRDQAISTGIELNEQTMALVQSAKAKMKRGEKLTPQEAGALALYEKVMGPGDAPAPQPSGAGMQRPEAPIDPEMEPPAYSKFLTPRNIGIGVALIAAYMYFKK